MTDDVQSKAPAQVGVVLKYDIWDDDGNRIAAAPIEGTNDEGMPVRSQITMLSKPVAEKLVRSGKAEVPLK